MCELSVLLADDDAVLLNGLSGLLAREEGINLVAAVSNGAEAIAAMAQHQVDVALLDIDMPKLDGITTAEIITSQYPETTVVMLTAFAHSDFLERALLAGAKGFLTKDIPPTEIASLVREAHSGVTVMGRKPTQIITQSYLRTLTDRQDYSDFVNRVNTLSRAQKSVFDLLIQAIPNRTIARRLDLSEHTVRSYVSQILQKTDCQSRSEIAVKALKSGIRASTQIKSNKT